MSCGGGQGCKTYQNVDAKVELEAVDEQRRVDVRLVITSVRISRRGRRGWEGRRKERDGGTEGKATELKMQRKEKCRR